MKKISIIWNYRNAGEIEVRNGKLMGLFSDKAEIDGNRFSFSSDSENRLDISIGLKKKTGSHGAIVYVKSQKNPFCFFAEHVSSKFPVYIPEYSVIVTEAGDKRPYRQIEQDIKKKSGLSKLKEIEFSPEQTYQEAAENTRKLRGNTWLGISRANSSPPVRKQSSTSARVVLRMALAK